MKKLQIGQGLLISSFGFMNILSFSKLMYSNQSLMFWAILAMFPFFMGFIIIADGMVEK